MKKILTFLFLISIFFSLQANAQNNSQEYWDPYATPRPHTSQSSGHSGGGFGIGFPRIPALGGTIGGGLACNQAATSFTIDYNAALGCVGRICAVAGGAVTCVINNQNGAITCSLSAQVGVPGIATIYLLLQPGDAPLSAGFDCHGLPKFWGYVINGVVNTQAYKAPVLNF